MASKLIVRNWIQKLLPVCDGDAGHAKRQLEWLKEKVTLDVSGNSSKSIYMLSKQEHDQLDTYITQRTEQHKPLQYILATLVESISILGTQPFCELDIVTRPPTLIPRWETEEWTYRVIDMLKNQLSTVQKPLRILDVCTGSGCISLALAKHLPKDSVHITGLDISTRAISLSQHNLDLHQSQLQNPVEFHVQDVFQYIPQDEIHLIVSNPPYITNEEYKTLDPDVKDWEDARALVAPDQGTRVHQGVIQVAKYCTPLTKGPHLLMEMGGTHQIKLLSGLMLQQGFKTIDVWKDLAGKDRVITGGF
ncbi:methylase of polypeptide chain release factors [Mucor ambiguus]|uniref:peptide chain release factor N(5)-glutamine methyltransferase n=1 Tax=Mucor ambiguus TaxID=91626 RepID=A0A0C9M3E7_9FUNG|nr:methylase of polypeptide chain release factors [Mucor ambiguus]